MGIRALPFGEWPEELGDSGFKSASIFVQHKPIHHAAGLTRQSRLFKGTCSKLTARQGPPPRDRRSVMPTDFARSSRPRLRICTWLQDHAVGGRNDPGRRQVCEALLSTAVHYHCDQSHPHAESRRFMALNWDRPGPSGWPRHQLPHFACSAAGRCPGPMPGHGTE